MAVKYAGIMRKFCGGNKLINKIYKPKYDGLFFGIWIPTLIALAAGTAFSCLARAALFVMISVDLFTLYFLVSPLSGYVELRENSLFIKYGFFLKKEIPYSTIRGIEKQRKFYSESMLSLKGAVEHVNIKYNSFDVTTVSVKENDAFLTELQSRIGTAKN